MTDRIFSLKHAVLLFLLFMVAIPAKVFAEELPQPEIGEVALADLRGKFVVIHFATSW
jgi:hypothetical protein